ncbi:cytochrome P450 [Actinomadura fibrosa]|uniref:Cytochrome P450 n=1 Tax=Actinomadura fibrosa TaxID=111802 RepID=A0ABW2XU15_9ACTN|nr:cytochrome P450 [Actinomadura fibrosa]
MAAPDHGSGSRRFGVAPGALPLVGHAWELLRDPLAFAARLPSYGDLVEVRLGPARAYVPCHPELLSRVLRDGRTFDKGGPFYDRARGVLGGGVGTCRDAEHRRQRRLLQPAFSAAHLERYSAVMAAQFTALSEGWRDGQVIDAYPVLYEAAMRTVLGSLFATRAGTAAVETVHRSVETILDHLFRRMFLPGPLQRVPTAANRRFDAELDALNRSVAAVIADYRRAGEDHGDLLSTMLATRRQDDGGLSDTEIAEQVLTMLVAGGDPVASTLSWALWLLAGHPAAAERIRRESETVLGGQPVRGTDAERLGYTGRVVTETLRLYPPGWLFTRVTSAPVELAGRTLPAGATVLFMAPVLHRQAALYPEPRRFDPDRWLPERAAGLPHGAFAAFGGGARQCLGNAYATIEAVLALSIILGRWKVRCAAGTDARPAAMATNLRPRRLLLRLTRVPAAEPPTPSPPGRTT